MALKCINAINHIILIHKLGTLFIYRTPLKWLDSYLRNQKQFFSSYASLNVSDCPWSTSVLGPLLFLFNVNEIADFSK